MTENMFEIRKKESRRKQFIEENLDVADEIINTAPLFKNEEIIEDVPAEKEEDTQKADNIIPFKLSLYKKEKINKISCTYYLESAIDDLVSLIGEKTAISKSELVNLMLKSSLLSNEDIQELSKYDENIQNLLEKLKKWFPFPSKCVILYVK